MTSIINQTATKKEPEAKKQETFFATGHKFHFRFKTINLKPDLNGQYFPKTEEEKAYLKEQAKRGFVNLVE